MVYTSSIRFSGERLSCTIEYHWQKLCSDVSLALEEAPNPGDAHHHICLELYRDM